MYHTHTGNDRRNESDSGITPASFCTADLNHLRALVEGLIDADILLAEDAASLLEAIETARQRLSESGAHAAKPHIERLAHIIEALVQTEALTLADCRAVVLATDRMLSREKDAGNARG